MKTQCVCVFFKKCIPIYNVSCLFFCQWNHFCVIYLLCLFIFKVLSLLRVVWYSLGKERCLKLI